MQLSGISSLQFQEQRVLYAQKTISGVEQGDILSAEVTARDGARITLTLKDGAQIHAQQQSNTILQEGDSVLLEVQTAGAKGMSLSLSQVNGQDVRAQMPALAYALMRMDLPDSRANMAYASALQELKLPLMPQTILRMQALKNDFPALPQESAALFAASSLPATAQNIQAFEAFLHAPISSGAFARALETLMHENPFALQAAHLALQAEAQAGVDTATDIGAQSETPIQPEAQTLQTADAPQAQGDLPPALHALTPKSAAYVQNAKAFLELFQENPTIHITEAKSVFLQTLVSLPREATLSDKQLLLHTFKGILQNAQAESGGVSAGIGADISAPDTRAPKPEQMQPPEREAYSPAPQVNLQAEQAAAQLKPEQGAKEIISRLFAYLDAGDRAQQGEALKEKTSFLGERISAISAALKSGEANAPQIKGATDMGAALAAQLDMGNSLGNMLYAQIPWTYNQQQHSAELYLLKRERGGKAVDPSNAVIALCVETERMGRLETLLRVEQNALSIQFRAESKAALRHIKNDIPAIRQLDFPPQYTLHQVSVVLRDEKLTPANAGAVLQGEVRGAPLCGTLDLSI